MELLIITAISEFGKDIKRLLKKNGGQGFLLQGRGGIQGLI